MSRRQPEAWQTRAPGPFLRTGGDWQVEVWALGGARFKVRAPEHEDEQVEGFAAACELASALAEQQ